MKHTWQSHVDPEFPGELHVEIFDSGVAVTNASEHELLREVHALADSLSFSKTQVTDLAAWKDRLAGENRALRQSLSLLADAAEDFVSSDADMPSHRDSERAFDEALAAARALLEKP